MTRALPLALALSLFACGDDGTPPGSDGGGGFDSGGLLDGAVGVDRGGPLDGGGRDAGIPPGRYAPTPGTSWQWQLTEAIDTSIDVEMYDIDLFDVPASVLAELHGMGRRVVCYFSAGSYEEWRDDAGDFPGVALGQPLDGWPGERWLDVRDTGVRGVMRARLDLAVKKGCDGVEPDNVDGHTNRSGFDFDAADQLDYNRFLATEAHARGLSIGLKNDIDQIGALVTDFDWALNEECVEYDECDAYAPFISAGKAVFHAEYVPEPQLARVCAVTRPLGLDTIIKRLELDAWRIACP